MPLGSATVDSWVSANSGAASGQITQTRFEQELWKAVNLPRHKQRRAALAVIQAGYPTLSPETIVNTLRAEVTGVGYP